MSYPIVVSPNGLCADTLIDTTSAGDLLDVLLRAEIVRRATDDDRETVRSLARVSYPNNGVAWGDGAYVVSEASELLVLAHGFTFDHLRQAISRVRDFEQETKRLDLVHRIDNVLEGRLYPR
jgi:hypothetical protein